MIRLANLLYTTLLIIFIVLVIPCGCLERTTITTQYDVVKYDLGEKYFIYTDNDEIKTISWDSSGWNAESNHVTIIESNKTYVDKHELRIGKYAGINEYTLYVNLSELPK